MTNARDLLAAELEIDGLQDEAAVVRRGTTAMFGDLEAALRAIEKALSLLTFTQGVEAAAKVAEQDLRTDLAKEYGHAPAWHVHGQRIAAAIRSLTPSGDPADLPLGAAVQFVPPSAPTGTWRDDWRDWTGFVSAVRWCPEKGLDYEVSEEWPPRQRTDGFAREDLCLSPPPTASSEDENGDLG